MCLEEASPNQQAKVSHAGVILDLPVQAFTACDRKETPTISSSGCDCSEIKQMRISSEA